MINTTLNNIKAFSLALFFNGTLLYFYIVFRLGKYPCTLTTGVVYITLITLFLVPQIILLMRKDIFLHFNKVDLAFLCLLILMTINFLTTSLGSDTALKKYLYAPFLMFMPYLAGRMLLSEKTSKLFFCYILIISFVLLFLAYFELLFNDIHDTRTRFAMYIFPNLWPPNNPILFGNTFSVFIIIMTICMSENKFSKNKFMVWLTLTFLSVYLIVQSGSRGVHLSLITALCFYLIFINKSSWKFKLFIFSFLIVAYAFSCFAASKNIKDYYKYTVSEKGVKDTRTSINQRIVIYKAAIKDISEKPVLGVGFGKSALNTGFPHNIVLEVMAEFGLPGLAILLFLLFSCFKEGLLNIKQYKDEKAVISILAFVLFICGLVHSMFSYQLTNNIYLYLPMGLIAALTDMRNYKYKQIIAGD